MPICIKCKKEETPLYSINVPGSESVGQAHCTDCLCPSKKHPKGTCACRGEKP